jgi:hypothetical protein
MLLAGDGKNWDGYIKNSEAQQDLDIVAVE